jgi:hypothetical protein
LVAASFLKSETSHDMLSVTLAAGARILVQDGVKISLKVVDQDPDKAVNEIGGRCIRTPHATRNFSISL